MRYVFGDCILDTERRELHCAGTPVQLERKVYQVLTYLVQHADRVVSKDELLEHVWPHVYVTDKAVARCIVAIRKAVGDRSDLQRLVRTVHGQGYCLVVPVATHAGPVPPPETASPLPESPRITAPVLRHASAAPSAPARPSEAVVPPSRPAQVPSGERKLVTVLCCNLAKTAAMAEGVDPEEQHHLLQMFFAHAHPEVRRYTQAVLPEGGTTTLSGTVRALARV